MSKEKVIAVFDIGKTNKKLLLFNDRLHVLYQTEEKFDTTLDQDGDECDDIEEIEKWIQHSLAGIIKNPAFDLVAVNFSTYGASLAFLDDKGERLTPVFNYLKEIPATIRNTLFDRYEGKEQFCRRTASPALGSLLNSGIQILWLKQIHPDIFGKVRSILHFPQYLSYILTKEIVAEPTSIGCHTFMWDYDINQYHQWISDEGISLPLPLPNKHTFQTKFEEKDIAVGIGIHDSSASLVPYLRGSKDKFLLISTGTWCINMNPFNHTPLTTEQLNNDCLAYLSPDQSPVKSSRLFMGHIHDVNNQHLSDHFNVSKDSYKKLAINEKLISYFFSGHDKRKVFFEKGVPENYLDDSVELTQFKDYTEAYHRLMYDLTLLDCESIELITDKSNAVKIIYVSGGFARNELFVRLLATIYPEKEVYTTDVDNSSALGAALVIWDTLGSEKVPDIDLGLKKWEALI